MSDFVDYALVFVLIAIVVVAVITLTAPTSMHGEVICPNATYVGDVYTNRSDVYRIVTESGTVLAPKDLCVAKVSR